MDKSGANEAAIDEIGAGREVLITVRQVKYLNNNVEQNRRAIKRVTRPIVLLKSFRSASIEVGGVELIDIVCKAQSAVDGLM
ncbi:DDE-type integrase/transposase/recombinase [Massilia aurea]|nr:DDE-type integrase/transposase/recombinase [Massilia aurea]